MNTLYGVSFSPYSGKVRAYLKYKNIPYREVFANWFQYVRVIKPQTGVMYIPVFKNQAGQYLQDSSVIIDSLEQQYPDNSITPPGVKQQFLSLMCELYGDEWMVPFSCLHYRWNFSENLPVLFPEFGRIAFPRGPRFLRALAGEKISARFRGFMPKLGLTKDICSAVEQRHEQLLGLLDEHFSKHSYLLGERASLGDFGLFGPLYAHLYLDPAPRKLMDKLAPNLVLWIQRMEQQPVAEGDWLADDQVAAPLETLLEMILQDQIPLLLEAARRVDDWADQHPGQSRVPGALSGMEFNLCEASASRMVLSAPVWKLQRVLDYCQRLPVEQKQQLADWLGPTATALLSYQQRHRLIRRDNQVVIDTSAKQAA